MHTIIPQMYGKIRDFTVHQQLKYLSSSDIMQYILRLYFCNLSKFIKETYVLWLFNMLIFLSREPYFPHKDVANFCWNRVNKTVIYRISELIGSFWFPGHRDILVNEKICQNCHNINHICVIWKSRRKGIEHFKSIF